MQIIYSIKKNTKKFLFLFCISLNLDKNLTLRKEKIFSFPSLNRFFALSFDKIGGVSEIKIKKFYFYFVFRSTCTIFAVGLWL